MRKKESIINYYYHDSPELNKIPNLADEPKHGYRLPERLDKTEAVTRRAIREYIEQVNKE